MPSAPVKLLASAISVDFDLTFLAQFLLFTAFIMLIKPLLFDPLLRVFEERERRTEGAKAEAAEMDAEAGRLLGEYEAAREKVRKEAEVEREKLRAATAKLEAQIMADARAETTKILESGKAKIAVDVAELRKEIERIKPELAAQIASRILDREVAQ
ncbi:MAG: ATP synthase F0 subunit B [Byssovorax sp.]